VKYALIITLILVATSILCYIRIKSKKDLSGRLADYEYADKLSGTLAEITRSNIMSTGDLVAPANLIALNGCKALGVRGISIWQITDDRSTLKNISSYDIYDDEFTVKEDFSLSCREKYAAMLENERLVVTNNIRKSDILSSLLEDYDPDLCALLDAPIRIGDKMVGVVCVEQNRCEKYPEEREWTIIEQSFAASLADLAALVISGYKLRKAHDAAEIANKSKSTFLANMSHEIRTPMNAILGITEMLIQDETLPRGTLDALVRVYNSCDLLLGIINDILDFSKIEAGKMDIVPTLYPAASLINDTVQLNMMRIGDKQIKFELQIDENLPEKLIGDELRIKQILNNLLSNAFKYTAAGKVTLSIASAIPSEGWATLVLRVRDTGYGMTDKQVESVFDEYSRFYREEFKTVEGTGLGLAITQSLVGLMDGTIQVESKQGEGTLFEVQLPQKLVGPEILGPELAESLRNFKLTQIVDKKRSQIVRDPMPYGSVLLVDDVETNLYVANGLLKPYGLKIDSVMSGKASIEKVRGGEEYDIIFMDHMMPEMDGIEVTEILREMGYTLPIVALTANAVAGQADLFLQNGFDAFISKPIDVRQLNAVLNRFVRDKQPPEVIERARSRSHPGKASGGQTDFAPLLIESFVRDARKTITLLENLFQNIGIETEDGLKGFVVAVHGIKSSLGNIGQEEMSELAYKLELAGRNVDLMTINESGPDFFEMLRRICEEYEKEIHPEHADGTDGEELKAALTKLQGLCADYDRKGVLGLLSGIKECSRETREGLDRIKDLVIHSEFEEAGIAAECLMERLK